MTNNTGTGIIGPSVHESRGTTVDFRILGGSLIEVSAVPSRATSDKDV
jgi:hypothetical protein